MPISPSERRIAAQRTLDSQWRLRFHHDGGYPESSRPMPTVADQQDDDSAMTSPWTAFRSRFLRPHLHLDRGELLVTAATLALSSLAAFAAHDFGEVASALVFVLGITIAGALSGLASALLAALAAFLIYNFYLTEPALTFRLATGGDIAPLIVFNLCALVSGVLAGQLKDHAQAARSSNLQLNSLLALSQALQVAQRQSDMIATIERAAHEILGARVALYRIEGDTPRSLSPRPVEPEWQVFAECVARQGMLVERGLMGLCLDPRDASLVLVLEPLRPAGIKPAFLEALGNLIALALERAALAERIAEASAAARAEELKSALLASVSHDFRTPLTAISASASSLVAYSEKFDPATATRLLRGIVEECERLNRYTANLLEMSRMETGGGAQPLQILSAAEMAAAALQRVRPRAGLREMTLTAPDDDLLVAANPALFELVLINILDNAILYSGEDARIVVAIQSEAGACQIDIADNGQGIPEHALLRVFDRFYRAGRSETTSRGSGLGLAIAKGFVEALGGTIAASLPGIDGQGTRITIRLPFAEFYG